MWSLAAGAPGQDTALSMAGLRLRDTEAGDAGFRCAFDLRPGELAVAELGDPAYERLLFDVIAGLIPPEAGALTVLGRPWPGPARAETAHARARRGRIGRAFARGAWIDGLSVADNLALVERYHTRRPPEAILAEADGLCPLVELPGLPTGAVADLAPEDRARLALLRAVLGAPALVLVESGAVDAAGLAIGRILDLCRRATDGGAAVLLCMSTPVTEILDLPVDRRLRFDRLALTAGEDAP